MDDIDMDRKVTRRYLQLRDQVLNYTNEDMNLRLSSDEQVYIALFDIPVPSGLMGFQTQSLALVMGCNTHLYSGSGAVMTGLEKYPEVLKASTSLLISSHQVLPVMRLTADFEFYNSENIRVFLKTRNGVYFKELSGETREDKFLESMMGLVIMSVNKAREQER